MAIIAFGDETQFLLNFLKTLTTFSSRSRNATDALRVIEIFHIPMAYIIASIFVFFKSRLPGKQIRMWRICWLRNKIRRRIFLTRENVTKFIKFFFRNSIQVFVPQGPFSIELILRWISLCVVGNLFCIIIIIIIFNAFSY